MVEKPVPDGTFTRPTLVIVAVTFCLSPSFCRVRHVRPADRPMGLQWAADDVLQRVEKPVTDGTFTRPTLVIVAVTFCLSPSFCRVRHVRPADRPMGLQWAADDVLQRGAQVYGTGGPWRGSRLLSQSDTVLGQGVVFGYDEFNRLTSRTVTQGTLQNYTYSYDLYGNRLTQTALQTGYNFYPTINPVNNQITTAGFGYDAAGNMTNESINGTTHSYKYDAEGNIIAVDNGSTAQYVYDVFNHRIHEQTPAGTTEYIYDYAGRRVSSWVSPNNQANEGRIYWGGQLVAHRSLEALTYFDHEDTLGTQRIRTNYAGWTASSYLSLPWGDGYTATVNNAGGDQDNLHFAGLERDAESGTEHAQFRNYDSAQGRWLAPDSYLGSYDLTNPQSMNRYAYALNNPTSLVDPSGLAPCIDGIYDPTCGGSVGDGGGGGETPPPGYTLTGVNTYDGNPIYVDANGDKWIGLGPSANPANSNGSGVEPGYLDPFGYFSAVPQQIGPAIDASSGIAPNNGPRPGCVQGALLSNAVSVGIDAVGLIPEAGGVARLIGNQAGYRGVVADQLGAKIIGAFGKSTSTVNGLSSITDTSGLGLASTALTITGFIPGLGQASAALSLGVDLFKTYKAVSACYSHP